DHPEALLVLVVLEHPGSNGVDDPLSIGAHFGLRNIANLEKIVNCDVAWSSGSGLRDRFLGGQPQNYGKRGERDAANGFHAHNSSELGWSANRGRSLAEGATENGWKNSAPEPARTLPATTRRVLDRNSAQADGIDQLEIAVWAPMASARVRTEITGEAGT